MMLGFFVLGPLVKYATHEENGKFMARPGLRGIGPLGAEGKTRFAAVQAQFRPPEQNTEAQNRARSQYGAIQQPDAPDAAEIAKRKAAGEAIMKKHEAEMKAQGKTGHGSEYGARLPDDYFGDSPSPSAPSPAKS